MSAARFDLWRFRNIVGTPSSGLRGGGARLGFRGQRGIFARRLIGAYTGGQRKTELTTLLSGQNRRPAAFLDRDGVLNIDHGYAHRPDQLDWVAGAPQAVRLLNEAGYIVIVVTNQSGVARGYFSEAAVKLFHATMQERLLAAGARIDAFYYCPHHPEGAIPQLSIRCQCRKPAPGMLEQAAQDWPIDPARSFMIGDRDDDVSAAQAFGIRGIKFDSRNGSLVDLVRREIASTG